MDNSLITTYQDTTPSAEDSAKENRRQGQNNKRKRQDDEITNPFFKPFAVTPHSQKTTTSHTFIPIAHLPRADLPLIWLDHTTPAKKPLVTSGALLNAQLQRVHSEALKDSSLTLVARLAPNGGLCVLERAGEDEEVYIVFALQSWVSESRVIGQSLGTFISREDDLQALLGLRYNAVPARRPPSTLPRTPKQPKDRRGAQARMSILPAKDAGTDIETRVDFTHVSSPLVPRKPSSQLADNLLVLAEPLDVGHLRVQYLETLYSKTSLAYLTKGPLTRARHQAHSDMSSLETLLEFYRESIISMKKLDLKYKESVNKIIESAKSSQHADGAPEEPQKKASRKKKMGRDVLYPTEEAFITRCWFDREARKSGPITIESQGREQRNFGSDLRTRETKMQIILILEVLILENMLETTKKSPSDQQNPNEEEAEDGGMPTILAKTPTKPKTDSKPIQKDYSTDLDTLLDRLCIWYTVGTDDIFRTPEENAREGQESAADDNDQLQSFCAEVVIPFYASHLPQKCNMILKKLGGSEISPKRSKAAPNKSTSTLRLVPGSVIKRRPQAVPRKTLERVLSDDRIIRHASPPILARSSTAPLAPNLKREPSESFQRPGSRGALHKSVSFSNREIDLDADARVQEAKRRKLARVAEQKKQLDAAITAIKKPNRSVAAYGFMDEIESRAHDSNPPKQTVHITATPKRSKSRSFQRHEPTIPSTLDFDDDAIPSSTIRPRCVEQYSVPPQASAKKRAMLFAIHETPTRPSSAPPKVTQKPVSQLNFSSAAKSGSISSEPAFVESTPATNRMRPDLLTQVENTPLRLSKSARPASLMPPKKTVVGVEEAFRDVPIIPREAGKAMDRVMGGTGTIETSVYDALGWNDDYDL